MGVNAYATEEWRANSIRNYQPNNYRTFVKKLIQLESYDWPKFQEQLKNLYSAKIHQTEALTKIIEFRTSTHTTRHLVTTDDPRASIKIPKT